MVGKVSYDRVLAEILEQLRRLNDSVGRLEDLIEERLVGVEEPLPNEVKAIKKYEEAKKKGKVSLVRLEDLR
ncbi:hypothetical protein DRO53_01175 [Candidatus Bathyarchaeota archaeon]|nr:MAG: hypothetical protein DRO53_01175 [Candidatus Bathyarchaeota archaeon]